MTLVLINLFHFGTIVGDAFGCVGSVDSWHCTVEEIDRGQWEMHLQSLLSSFLCAEC